MDDHLAKPISFDALYKCLAHWVLGDTSTPSIVPGQTPPAPSPANLPLFDERVVLENFDNDRGLFDHIISSTMIDLPNYLDALQHAVEQQAWLEAGKTAHTMKGLTAQIGGLRLSAELQDIEQKLRNGETINNEAVAHVRQQFNDLKAALTA